MSEFSKKMLRTPVVLFLFKRPDTTRRVFEVIRQARPSRLFLVADGPTIDRPDEIEKCDLTRNIVEDIDWDCNILRNYADHNMGCRNRISSGLDWVFTHVDEAIILEDDCLPDISFFQFCEELLERYRDQPSIMHISGDNFQLGNRRSEHSYFFSRYAHVWGWATWRRAWCQYDVDMQHWPKLRAQAWLSELWKKPDIVHFWDNWFQEVYEKRVDTWDIQWVFSCWRNGGYGIIPEVNLVSNIGFGQEAHHTTSTVNPFSNLPVKQINFPLQHPDKISPHETADQYTFDVHYQPKLYMKLLMRITSMFCSRR